MTPPRAVFDCMVFLQGAGRPQSPARACFTLVDTGLAELCLSARVLTEVEDVLSRPAVRAKFPDLTPEWVERFLADVKGKAVVIADVPAVFSYPRDPKDEPYVNLALAAGARYLVTRDTDLLDLMDEGVPEGEDFRQRFPGLTVVDPVTFLATLRPREADPQPNTS